jgi:hypothetical protein
LNVDIDKYVRSVGWEFAGNPFHLGGFVMFVPLTDNIEFYYSDDSTTIWNVIISEMRANVRSVNDFVHILETASKFGVVKKMRMQKMVPVIVKNSGIICFGCVNDENHQLLLKASFSLESMSHLMHQHFNLASVSHPDSKMSVGSCFFYAVNSDNFVDQFISNFMESMRTEHGDQSTLPEELRILRKLYKARPIMEKCAISCTDYNFGNEIFCEEIKKFSNKFNVPVKVIVPVRNTDNNVSNIKNIIIFAHI